MKLKVLLLIAQGFLRRKSVTNAKGIFPLDFRIPPEMGKDSSMQHFWYMTSSSCFEFSFSFSSDRATMYNTGTFKLAIV